VAGAVVFVGAAAARLAFWSPQVRLLLVTVKWRWICRSLSARSAWRAPSARSAWRGPVVVVSAVARAWCLWPLLEAAMALPLYLLFPVLLRVLLRVKALVSAGETDSTAGVNRGVAPADVSSAFLRSWRPRQVAAAATSTRLSPLKVCSGDSAAACWCFFSPSGKVEASMQAAADLIQRRRSRGLGCSFSSFQGSFCKLGTAVPGLDGSCNFMFPYLI
jgi:hypothetical protein